MKIQGKIIKKGTILYRYIPNKKPTDVKLGIRQNKGENGRCNLHRNIYYCSLSMEALKEEFNNSLNGSIIISIVTNDIEVGSPKDTHIIQLLCGATLKEVRSCEVPLLYLGINEINDKIGLSIKTPTIIDYKLTSGITESFLKYTPDGIIYPSCKHAAFTIKNSDYMYISDNFNLFNNIALTEQGYSKIKEGLILSIKEV